MGSVTDSAAEHRGRCGHEFGVVACSPAVREYRRVFEPGADPMTEGDRASVRSTAVFVEPARVLPDNQQDPYRRRRRLRGPCSSAVLPLCSHRLGQRQLGERGSATVAGCSQRRGRCGGTRRTGMRVRGHGIGGHGVGHGDPHFRSVSDVRVCSRVRAMCRRSGRPELRSLGEVVGAVANLLCGDRAQPPSLEAALQHRGWGEERGPGTVGGRFSRALLRALAMSR